MRIRVQLRKELIQLDQMANRSTEDKSESEVQQIRKQKVLSLDLLLTTAKCVHLTVTVLAYLHHVELAYVHTSFTVSI